MLLGVIDMEDKFACELQHKQFGQLVLRKLGEDKFVAELGSKLGKGEELWISQATPTPQTWLVKDLHVSLQKLAVLPLLSTESQSKGSLDLRYCASQAC